MALDAVGLQQPLRYTVDLKEGLVQQPMSSQLMKGDKKANRVIVRITNGSETVDLSGVGVSGSFIRPPDEAELTLSGSVNGNEAVIVLDDLCYAEEGYCEIDVKLTVNGVSRTVLALTGYVLAKGNGAYIDVGNVIPNIDDIIAQYAEMKAVTERTLAAAQRAEALAIDASGYAANTGMLGGQPPSYYATAERANQLSQQMANDYLLKTGTAADSAKLGGVAASEYAKLTDRPMINENTTCTVTGFPANPTTASNTVYTTPADGIFYLFATRGETAGNTIRVYILKPSGETVAQFNIPAYYPYAMCCLTIPVKRGMEIKVDADSASATWMIREQKFFY